VEATPKDVGGQLIIRFKGIKKDGFTMFMGESSDLVYVWSDGKWVLKTT